MSESYNKKKSSIILYQRETSMSMFVMFVVIPRVNIDAKSVVGVSRPTYHITRVCNKSNTTEHIQVSSPRF